MGGTIYHERVLTWSSNDSLLFPPFTCPMAFSSLLSFYLVGEWWYQEDKRTCGENVFSSSCPYPPPSLPFASPTLYLSLSLCCFSPLQCVWFMSCWTVLLCVLLVPSVCRAAEPDLAETAWTEKWENKQNNRDSATCWFLSHSFVVDLGSLLSFGLSSSFFLVGTQGLSPDLSSLSEIVRTARLRVSLCSSFYTYTFSLSHSPS
jgi:hypothetical protein